MRHDPAAPPPVVLECEDLAFDYDTHKDAFGLRDVSLRLRAGRALGVIGLNGAGKSTPVSYTHLTLPTTPYV